MAKIIMHKSKNPKHFLHLNRAIIEDTKLSWKAKGLFVYLASRNGSWDVNLSDLLRKSSDKLGSLRSGLKELIKSGYVYRAVKRSRGSYIEGWKYYIFETPISKEKASEIIREDGYKIHGKMS